MAKLLLEEEEQVSRISTLLTVGSMAAMDFFLKVNHVSRCAADL